MSWPGASNIQDGVVFDLRGLDTIIISTDQASISSGVGATWDQLYEALDPYGLSVNGGRAAGVGKQCCRISVLTQNVISC